MEWDHFGALGGNKVFLKIKKTAQEFLGLR
jgi:hypothetical protein